jgi:hypothetical protein
MKPSLLNETIIKKQVFYLTVRPGRDADPSPPSSAEVKNRVELYLYSPKGPSWPMKGWNVPFILLLKNAGEEWGKLNAAVEKKEGVSRFGVQEFWNWRDAGNIPGKKSFLCDMKR